MMVREPKARRTILGATLLGMLAAANGRPALADNAACWGYSRDDKERPDISCTELVERFLISMRGATRAEVLKAMNAAGRPVPNDGLHFISNYARGTKGYGGDVNFFFDDDKVTAITGEVDGPPSAPGNIEFIWNAKLPGCSDFPGSRNRCTKP